MPTDNDTVPVTIVTREGPSAVVTSNSIFWRFVGVTKVAMFDPPRCSQRVFPLSLIFAACYIRSVSFLSPYISQAAIAQCIRMSGDPVAQLDIRASLRARRGAE